MMDQIKEIEKFISDHVNSAHSKGVVLGMSGGKDSLICAKLCSNALGKDKVVGMIMPNGEMKDINIAIESCKLLGIRYYNLNINDLYNIYLQLIKPVLKDQSVDISSVTTINLPPRLRTICLYALAGSLNYLVVNTSNLSEKEVGYTTKWGDNIGDFAPLVNFTKNEVVQIGLELGLPRNLVIKTPDDGLSGKSDEEKLGFSYDELDKYIREGKKGTNFEKINKMHMLSQHKRIGVVPFKNNLPNYFDIDQFDMNDEKI